MLGRVYTIHPSNTECYYSRMLLHHVRRPTSFTILKTTNDIVHPTFQKTQQAFEFLEDKNNWNTTPEETALFQLASKLREFFVVIIAFSHITNLPELWENYKNNMLFDVLQQEERHRSSDCVLIVTPYTFNKVLILIEN